MVYHKTEQEEINKREKRHRQMNLDPF